MYESCRDELLTVVTELVNGKNVNEFSVIEVIEAMKNNNTIYSEGTIRTHITSRCCANVPKHHGTTYDDYERVDKGIYRIKDYK